MTSLPSGLASISARLDDTPQVRGAVAFGRMVRERGERVYIGRVASPCGEIFEVTGGPEWGEAVAKGVTLTWGTYAAIASRPSVASLGSAIDRHAALAISAGYKGRDLR